MNSESNDIDDQLTPELAQDAPRRSMQRLVRHLDLFSGIGGFALAAQMVGGIKTVGFCEINSYAQKVLAKNFPEVPIHDDIKTLKLTEYGTIDLITGGFPCQPYSVAGKQLGHADERDLWPEMLRIIREAKPRWVLGENSPNVLNMAFDKIKTDLEAEGYEVGEPLVIPACAIGADHRRDRAWICAHLNPVRLQGGSEEEIPWITTLPQQPAGVFESERSRQCLSEPAMLRSLNGIPGGVDRIMALGNAIVPQVAAEILRCMMRVDSLHNT